MTRRPGPPKPAPPAPALARRAPQHRPLPRYPHAGHPDRLYGEELAPATRHAFARTIADEGHDPADYLYLPVHPWQWDETIAPLFAPQLADRSIIALPTDNDLRLPQQSIRTFLNLSRPRARTVKLPLSILNTLVWRGLPTERTLAAPAVTRWVHGLRDADPYLRDETRVILLGETASVTVEHPLYDRLPGVPYQFKELLGCIWREPVSGRLDPGERARTLAALLQTDPQGGALTAELVRRSGLAPRDWLARLFAALLPPLLHFLYRYGTVFSPHGENAIVVFDEHDVPTRLAVKDFVDDVNTSSLPLPEHDSMPDDVRAVLLTEPPPSSPSSSTPGCSSVSSATSRRCALTNWAFPRPSSGHSCGRRSCATTSASPPSRSGTRPSTCSPRGSSGCA